MSESIRNFINADPINRLAMANGFMNFLDDIINSILPIYNGTLKSHHNAIQGGLNQATAGLFCMNYAIALAAKECVTSLSDSFAGPNSNIIARYVVKPIIYIGSLISIPHYIFDYVISSAAAALVSCSSKFALAAVFKACDIVSNREQNILSTFYELGSQAFKSCVTLPIEGAKIAWRCVNMLAKFAGLFSNNPNSPQHPA